MSDCEMPQLRRSERIAAQRKKKEENDSKTKNTSKTKNVVKKSEPPKIKKEKMKIDKKPASGIKKTKTKPIESMRISDIFCLVRKYAHNITEKTTKYNILKAIMKYKGIIGVKNTALELISKHLQLASLICQKGVIANDVLLKFGDIEGHLHEILDYSELQLSESVNATLSNDIDDITKSFQKVGVTPNFESLIDILSQVCIK
jgi:hypothetical protein